MRQSCILTLPVSDYTCELARPIKAMKRNETCLLVDAKESWNLFQDKLQESIQKHISLKKKSKKKWMDGKCLEAVRKKHRAWNTYVHTQCKRDYQDYCKVRNRCTKVTRLAKRKYEKNIVINIKENPRDFWAYICQKKKKKTKAKSGVSVTRTRLRH